ncbi:universal stress protein [Halorientalis sp. IM1011]|jgi:nucleotide-binding universal stress UspA family protein|uniref:universal stress protein n=1 Tax=Halorientalis sp. IM1011 TaxID=1932360 RepID=UPI00097CD6A6|nr:universal stress protein [Halorientalis sp. IM1011]AQL44338.1 universal stress protein [Halorientalis sp. IM1011]
MRAVYATDLSEAIETAIGTRTCLECLGRYGIDTIDLVTVTSPNVTAGMPGSDVGKRTEAALERQRDLLEREGFAVETHVMRGTPHRRINGLADRVDANLVIVGSRGQSPLEQRLIGGTARNVARTSVRPLLVQRIVERDDDHEVADEHLFQRILYATDFSENAEHAFEQFDRLQTATKEALLVHVAPPKRRAGSGGVDDAEERLTDLGDDLRSRGIETTTQVREGVATDEILAAEAEFEPTTILLGARGKSPMRRLLLGSVSEDVTARANSNVLLVPPSRVR